MHEQVFRFFIFQILSYAISHNFLKYFWIAISKMLYYSGTHLSEPLGPDCVHLLTFEFTCDLHIQQYEVIIILI